MRLSKFSIGWRLGFGYAVTLVLMVTIASVGIVSLGSVNNNLDRAVNVGFKAFMVASDLVSAANAIQIAVRNIILAENKNDQAREKAIVDEGRAALAKSIEKLGNIIDTPEGKKAFEAMKEAIASGRAANAKAIELGLAGKAAEASKMLADGQYKVLLGKVEDLIAQQGKATVQMADSSRENAGLSRTIMITLSAVALVLGILIAFFLTRSITKPVNRVVEGLTRGAEQVSVASSQVSSASQSLAEGASEQAASIEETSSSLEEISSMTRQNAQAANDANRIMAETSGVVSIAAESMNRLTDSMAEISRASEETQKIIKTIDEIAFQTNLLALNAAVEAARAGEAGAGFAVVADEVRNLAMRAADAAKNTANLIEGTVKKIKDGSEMVTKTNAEFAKVSSSSARMRELVGEIAAASQEQAQGIEQINKGVSMMDKVVQQNASSAEESAAASEEMNAQAEQMKDYVAELAMVIDGQKNGDSTSFGRRAKSTRRHGIVKPSRDMADDEKRASKDRRDDKPAKIQAAHSREVGPERLLTAGDNDFDRF